MNVEAINEAKNCVKSSQIWAEIAIFRIFLMFAWMPSPNYETTTLNCFWILLPYILAVL